MPYSSKQLKLTKRETHIKPLNKEETRPPCWTKSDKLRVASLVNLKMEWRDNSAQRLASQTVFGITNNGNRWRNRTNQVVCFAIWKKYNKSKPGVDPLTHHRLAVKNTCKWQCWVQRVLSLQIYHSILHDWLLLYQVCQSCQRSPTFTTHGITPNKCISQPRKQPYPQIMTWRLYSLVAYLSGYCASCLPNGSIAQSSFDYLTSAYRRILYYLAKSLGLSFPVLYQ